MLFSYVAATHVLTVTVTAPPVFHGDLSHFDLARKDCLGTARNTTSKVWYTVANGVLSDTYYPTVDNTNVETLQYVVTDGTSFTDLQTRDMTYSVQALKDSGGMACRVTATAKSGKYTIATDYVTDPARNTVLMHVTFTPLDASYRLYVRYDATVNGNGGGGTGNGGADSATVDDSTGHPVLVSSDTNTATNAANRDYAQPVYAALDGPLADGSSGLVGGADDSIDSTNTDVADGNVVQHARVLVDGKGGATLALGFGASQDEAVGAAEGSLGTKFDKTLKDYKKGWKHYDDSLNKPPDKLKGLDKKTADALGDEYYLSANVLKASEDKTFPGAIVASLASPWGQAVSAGDPNNTYFGSYREVFGRDLYEAWTGLMAAGDKRDRARRDALPLRAPAASGRVDAAQQPRQRQDRAGLLQHAARRVRVPDPDGVPARPRRRVAVREPHQAGRELRRRRTARRSGPSAGRSRAATRRRRSPPRSPASSRRRRSRSTTTTTSRRTSGSASPTTTSARSRAGR